MLSGMMCADLRLHLPAVGTMLFALLFCGALTYCGFFLVSAVIGVAHLLSYTKVDWLREWRTFCRREIAEYLHLRFRNKDPRTGGFF